MIYLHGQGGRCKNASTSRIQLTCGDSHYYSTEAEAEECNIDGKPDTACYNRYSGEFVEGTRLVTPKTICTPDSSSLKPGSGATEGVQD